MSDEHSHDANAAPRFAVSVDLAVFTVSGDALQVLLVRRRQYPYEGMWALPGGFVRADLDANLERAAQRELREETGLGVHSAATAPPHEIHLEQLRAYWRRGRDPRPGQEVAAVAFLAIGPDLPEPQAGGDAAEAAWRPAADVLTERVALAFDHQQIVRDAAAEVRRRLEDTALATLFVPTEFTLAELLHVYEVIWGERLDKRNFYRKMKEWGGFITSTGRSTSGRSGRPAELYVRSGVDELRRPILRPERSAPQGELWSER